MTPARPSAGPGGRSAKDGFALPAVLTVVAVVTLVFLVAILALDSLTQETTQVRDDIRFRQTVLTQEARVSYLLSTSPFNARGLSVGGPRLSAMAAFGGEIDPEPEEDSGERRPEPQDIFMDGRFYRSADEAAVDLRLSLQDGAGQINLNWLNPDQRVRLFRELGLEQDDALTMADRLADYIDPDDLRLPRGAEAAEYARAKAGAPENGGLIRVNAVLGVLGWRDHVSAARWREMRSYLSADPTTVLINVNTAPARVLTVLFPISARQAQAVVERRQDLAFSNYDEFAAFAGVPPPSALEQSLVIPNGRITLKVVDRRSRMEYRSRLTVLPAHGERPIWTEDRVFSPASREDLEVFRTDVARLPNAAAF